MIIALTHEMHGTHIAYSDAEAKQAESYGWVRDGALSKALAGNRTVDKSLIERYTEKFGKPPHHKMLAETIEKALTE